MAGAAGIPAQDAVDAAGLETQLPADWRGACDLVVVTSDDVGQPVAGVQVGLRLGESSSVLRGLRTDEEGRLTVSGLAAGEWQVELQREGFMLYTAYLKLEPGKEPEVGFKSRQRTGSFWAPLEAVFLSAEDRITPAVRAGRQTAKEAERGAARAAKREEEARRREERQVERGRAARLVASAEPEPSRGEPAPKRPTGADVASPAGTGRESGAQRVASVDAGAAAPTGERDRPSPPAKADPSAAPRLLPNPDLLPAGACPECRPGEWSVSTQSVAAAAGGCGSAPSPAALDAAATVVAAATGAVAEALALHLAGPLAGYAGALWSKDGNDALRLLPEAVEQELRALLEPLAGERSSCPIVGVVLPAGARYVGFRYAAGQRTGMAECPPGQGCLIGEASWQGNPTIRDAGAVKLVWARFENASAQRERMPRLTVYFEPARTWLPPSG